MPTLNLTQISLALRPPTPSRNQENSTLNISSLLPNNIDNDRDLKLLSLAFRRLFKLSISVSAGGLGLVTALLVVLNNLNETFLNYEHDAVTHGMHAMMVTLTPVTRLL